MEEQRNNVSDMEILPLCFKIWTICGFWRPVRYCSPVSKFLYNCYSFVAFIILCSMTLFEFLDIVFNFGNLDYFANNAFMLLMVISDCYKAENTLRKRSRIIEIQDMLTDETCRAHNMEEQKILERCAKTCRSNTQNLLILITSCITFLFADSLVNGVNDRILPIKVWLPYSLSSLTSFYLSYLHQSLALTFAVCTCVANDTYVAGLMIQTCAQLDILKYRLHGLPRSRHFETDKDYFFSREESILKMCIRHHDHIFKLAAVLEETFSLVIFFQCFVSTTAICVTTFTLSKCDLTSLEFVTTFFIYFPPMILQLLAYCWYGNEVTLRSVEVRDAVFEMDWISLPVSMKKDLILLMVRADRPIKLTSGYVLTLSLDSFVAILKLSYSAFNVMQQSSDD